MSTDRLRLLAFDQDDLAVLSAHLQDARMKVGDLAYLPRERRFVLVAERVDRLAGTPCRRPVGLHVDRVSRASLSRLDLSRRDQPLDLLSILYEPVDPPGGTVTLRFAGGGAIRLTVECLECAMDDLGPDKPCGSLPDHGV